jgi:hypothetical protein
MTIRILVRDANAQEKLSSENKVTDARDDKGEVIRHNYQAQ